MIFKTTCPRCGDPDQTLAFFTERHIADKTLIRNIATCRKCQSTFAVDIDIRVVPRRIDEADIRQQKEKGGDAI